MKKIHPTVYGAYGIPSVYAKQSWDDIELPRSEKDRIAQAFNSPIQSVVFIQGTAAPIVNQLVNQGKSIFGININERLADAFGEHCNNKADVVLVHSVNSYSGRYEIATNILNSIIGHYKNTGALVLIQSDLGWTQLRDNWGFTPVNKIKLPLHKEQAWV